MLDDNNDQQPERPLRPLPSEEPTRGEPAWMRSLGGGEDDVSPSPVSGASTESADEESVRPWLSGVRQEASADAVAPAVSRSRRGVALIAAIAIAVGVIVGGGLVAASRLLGGAGQPANGGLPEQLAAAGVVSSTTSFAVSSSPTSASTATAVPAPADACPSKTEGTVVTGRGPGDTTSTAGVVLAFEYAYYVTRSAEAAFKLTSKESAFTDKGTFQAGIDSVPAGTLHCVKISPGGDTAAEVEVTERRPRGEPSVFRLTAETVREGGASRLVSMREATP